MKKWKLEEIKIRIENLKKVIPEYIINTYVSFNISLCEDECDAYNKTYYDLKEKYLRYNRRVFGIVQNMPYKLKKNNIFTFPYYSTFNDNVQYYSYNGIQYAYSIDSYTYTNSCTTCTTNSLY